MKTKGVLILLGTGLLFFSFVFSIVFRDEYDDPAIRDIDHYNFNDTIEYVRTYKSTQGPTVRTKLKNYDTTFAFSGYTSSDEIYYFTYPQEGDVLVKKPNADSFDIIRNDTVVRFKLSRHLITKDN